jgi:hypothetical protein
MGNPGAVATNYYQGTRSEYLAQYVFSMFRHRGAGAS